VSAFDAFVACKKALSTYFAAGFIPFIVRMGLFEGSGVELKILIQKSM